MDSLNSFQVNAHCLLGDIRVGFIIRGNLSTIMCGKLNKAIHKQLVDLHPSFPRGILIWYFMNNSLRSK